MADKEEEVRLNNLERRVEKMEGQFVELDKSVGVIGVYLEKSNQIQESNNKIQEKLSDAISSIQIAISEFRVELKHTSGKVEDVQTGLNDFKKEVTDNLKEIKSDVEEVDEKSKFDINDFIKRKVLPALISGGAIYGIWEAIQRLAETLNK